MKKWTQQVLRFCKNEGSKRSNNNEKGGQQDWKSRRKLAQIDSKVSNERFLWKIRPTLGQIISGTKFDKRQTDDYFLVEREGQKEGIGIEKGPNGIGKCQERGSIGRKFPTIFKYGSAAPLPRDGSIAYWTNMVIPHRFGQHAACSAVVHRNQPYLNEVTVNLSTPAWPRNIIIISLVLLDLLEILFILCCVHCMCSNYKLCIALWRKAPYPSRQPHYHQFKPHIVLFEHFSRSIWFKNNLFYAICTSFFEINSALEINYVS